MIGGPSTADTIDSTTKWYCKPIGNSYGTTISWIRASSLKTFLMGTLGKTASSVYTISTLLEHCSAGDVVQLTDLTSDKTYHSIIISYKSESTAKYCAHSTDRTDENVNKIDITANKLLLFSM